MPSIPLHPPPSSAPRRAVETTLPQLLRTPSGLAIIEVQGTLHTPVAAPSHSEEASRVAVGKLVFPLYSCSNAVEDTDWMKRVYLYVGKHQRLTGEVRELPNPIAVIRRRDGAGAETAGLEELEIAEIVRYKLLFAHRPEPVAGGAEQ